MIYIVVLVPTYAKENSRMKQDNITLLNLMVTWKMKIERELGQKSGF